MSFIYWLAKFSREAMLVELLLMGLICFSYFGYLLIQKRRYGAAQKQIPDHVVRAYLAQMISQAEGFKNQLFGSEFKISPGSGPTISMPNLAAESSASGGASAAELAALKTALATATAKQEELTKTMGTLTAEKTALEAKVKEGGAGGPPKDLLEKLAKLEAKLAEYEVIEDDLANLKKYQQENKQLKAQLEATAGGTSAAVAPTAAVAAVAPAPAPETPAPVVEATAPAPAAAPESPPAAAELATPDAAPVEAAVETPAAEAASPVANAEEAASTDAAAASFDGLVDKVEQSLTPEPAAASAADPKALEQAQTAAPVVEAAPAIQAVEDKPAEGAPKGEKSDADLLNEFERMLSS